MSAAAALTLSQGWSQRTRWVILDTGFHSADTFVALRDRWRADAKRPTRLHYVGILAPEQAEAAYVALNLPGAGLLPGFQRFLLESGTLSLTLCVGEVDAMLRELRMSADALLEASPTPDSTQEIWRLKALARLCRHGTRVFFDWARVPAPELLREVGLVPLTASPAEAIAPGKPLAAAEYAPHWNVRRKAHTRFAEWPAHKHAVVVGAGLAGASTAHALAQRGWRVTVLEQHGEPAQGASGLPVGLLVPHVSRDDSPRSRMSRAGVRLMMQHAQTHLIVGDDWAATGVLELHTDLPLNHSPTGWESHGRRKLDESPWASGISEPENSLWHPWAAWIKPQKLVQTWLKHPAINFRGHTRVTGIERVDHQWQLQADTGAAEAKDCSPNADTTAATGSSPNTGFTTANRYSSDTHATASRGYAADDAAAPIALADAVIFCNATGAAGLLKTIQTTHGEAVAWDADLAGKLAAMQQLFGTLSYGAHPRTRNTADAQEVSPSLPPFPVNGSGSFIPRVPYPCPENLAKGDRTTCWFAGSTFETDASTQVDIGGQHQYNQEKLSALLPAVAKALQPHFGRATHWQSSRCVSHDRLPLVGALETGPQPGLWINAAMGARGLSFAALCAELLAAEMEGEPLPLEASLAKALSVARPRRNNNRVG